MVVSCATAVPGRTWYEHLELPSTASARQIESAYRRKIGTALPDSLGAAATSAIAPDGAACAWTDMQCFADATEAHSILSNPEARAEYDTKLMAAGLLFQQSEATEAELQAHERERVRREQDATKLQAHRERLERRRLRSAEHAEPHMHHQHQDEPKACIFWAEMGGCELADPLRRFVVMEHHGTRHLVDQYRIYTYAWKHCARTCANVLADCTEKQKSSETFCSERTEHKKHAQYMQRHCPKTCAARQFDGHAVSMLGWGLSPDPWDWLYVLLSLLVPLAAITPVFLTCHLHTLFVDPTLDEWLYVLLILALYSAATNVIDGFEWDRWPPPWMRTLLSYIGPLVNDPLAHNRDVLAPSPDGPLPDIKFDFGACEGKSCMAVK